VTDRVVNGGEPCVKPGVEEVLAGSAGGRVLREERADALAKPRLREQALFIEIGHHPIVTGKSAPVTAGRPEGR
jgi:hypothetical protein